MAFGFYVFFHGTVKQGWFPGFRIILVLGWLVLVHVLDFVGGYTEHVYVMSYRHLDV